MLPLFFGGLLLYLVRMKRRTSRRVPCKKVNSHFFFRYLSPLMSEVYLLVTLFQSCMLPLFFSGFLPYLAGIKRRTSMQFACKRDNSLFLRYVLISLDVQCLHFWLTFFQSCMFSLFFSGLLSYSVGIKRRTSRHVACKRDN